MTLDIKPGDRVTLKTATVVRIIEGGAVVVQIDGEAYPSGVKPSTQLLLNAIASVEPRPLAVGDRMTWGHGFTSYRILDMTDERVVLVDGKREPDGEACPADGMIITRAHFHELDELRRVP